MNGNKLILKVNKSFHSKSEQNHSHSVASSNEVYQCLAELGNFRIVSQPAKLIIGELKAFDSPENSQDRALTVIAGNTAVIPCDLPQGVPFVISEFEFGNLTIAQSYGKCSSALCLKHFSNPFSFTDRYRLVPSGSLQIFHAKPIDSGSYRCVANNPYLAEKVYAHHFVSLKVIRHRHVPASERNKISWEVTPKKITSSILGQNITIECAAKGHPTPKIYWERQSGQLDKERNHIDGGNLHITTLGKADEGTYICIASNGKHTLRAETNLEVSEIPQIVNSEPYEVLDVEEGHDLELSCESSSYPRPFITWLHNGYIINNGQGPQNLFAFKSDDTVLLIRNANSNHSGILQCFMTNQLGSTYSIKMVNVRSVSSGDSAPSPSPSSPSSSSATTAHSDPSVPASVFAGHPKPHRGSTSEQMPANREDNEDLFLNNDDDGETGGTFEIRNGNNNHNFDQTLTINNNRGKKRKQKNMKLIPPNNPVVSALNEDSVMVRWSVSKQGGLRVTFFKVQFREAGKNDVNTVDEEIPAHIFSYSVSGLSSTAKYRFRIAAVYENNDNAKSNWTKFHFPRNAASKRPVVPPTIKSATALGQTEISLHWELSSFDSGSIEGFFIYYRPSESAGEYLKATSLGAETREHTLSHLVPGMMYEIKMRSFNPSGTSDFSNIYTIKTLPAKDSATTAPPESPSFTPTPEPGGHWPYPPERMLILIGALASSVVIVCLVVCVIRCKSQAPAPKVIKKGKVLKSSTPSDYYFNSTNVYDRRPNGQLTVSGMNQTAPTSRNNTLKAVPPAAALHAVSEAETDGKQLTLRLNALNEMSSLNRKNSFRSSLSHSTHHLFSTTNGKIFDSAYATGNGDIGVSTASTATIDRKRMMKSSCIEKPPYVEYPATRGMNNHSASQHSASFTRLNGTLERKRRSRTDLNTIDRSYLRNLSATAASEMDRHSNGNAAAFLGPPSGPIVIMQSSC